MSAEAEDLVRRWCEEIFNSRANERAANEPAEARRLLRKLEFHYTPIHGSWLNMAEIEIAVIGRECLRRRVGDRDTLERQDNALEAERNEQRRMITWSFTAYDARTKLRRLYPIPQA